VSTTFIVCHKCGATIEVIGPHYPAGWLVHQRKEAPQGHLVIRCPQHVTGHAKRLAGLPQKSDSKRIADNLDRGLWCENSNGIIVKAFENDGDYVLSFHAGRMPAFDSRSLKTDKDLLAAMREIQPDLRKWRLT
jgi:hypothetical protein